MCFRYEIFILNLPVRADQSKKILNDAYGCNEKFPGIVNKKQFLFVFENIMLL